MCPCFHWDLSLLHSSEKPFFLSFVLNALENFNTRSVRKGAGLPLHLRAIVFERPLRGMNVNSKASQTYLLLADICWTYSSCAACFCLQSYFWERRILWLLKMTEKQDQILFSTRKNEFGNYSDDAEGLWEWVYEQNTNKRLV